MLGGCFNFRLRCIGSAIGNITGNAVRKKEDVLLHNANIVAQGSQRHGFYIPAIDSDAPCLQLIKARHKITQRALTHARAAYEGYGFARFNFQREVFDNRLLTIISKGYVFKSNFTLKHTSISCLRPIGNLGL